MAQLFFKVMSEAHQQDAQRVVMRIMVCMIIPGICSLIFLISPKAINLTSVESGLNASIFKILLYA
jgi:hypothetical protein